MSAPHITVDVRSVYGVETIYPVDAAAKSFASIAGTRTLTPRAVRDIHRLGYDIRQVQKGHAWCPKCEAITVTVDEGETCGVCKLVLPGVSA